MRALASLPASCISQLQLWSREADGSHDDTDAALAAAFSSGAWPQLRRVTLPSGALPHPRSALAPALAGLRSLTSLTASPTDSTAHSACLPVQLQRLELYHQGRVVGAAPLALGH